MMASKWISCDPVSLSSGSHIASMFSSPMVDDSSALPGSPDESASAMPERITVMLCTDEPTYRLPILQRHRDTDVNDQRVGKGLCQTHPRGLPIGHSLSGAAFVDQSQVHDRRCP